MKIAVCSDLHLEFGPIQIENTENADVLILSGDIFVAYDFLLERESDIIPKNNRSDRFHEFLEKCVKDFKNVVYVMGNHEHYHGDFAKTGEHLAKICEMHGVHFLDKSTVKIDDITFVGGTLWTNMNNADSLTLFHLRGMMNDFRLIKNSNKDVSFRDMDGKFQKRPAKFIPDDAFEEHVKTLQYIQHVIEGKTDEKFVVVGHHAPCKKSTHPRYINDGIMNGGYSSDLSEFIMDHPQIKLWTHGHTHHKFDYMVGETRIVCNPRGYLGYETMNEKFDLIFVEV